MKKLNTSIFFLFTIIALTISAKAQTPSDLDPDFFGGRVLTRLIVNEQTTSTAIQADGKIVVAGYTANGTNGTDFFVARYNTNGVLDRTFASTAGWTVANFGSGFNEYSPDVAIAPDGKIVVAGRTCANPCTTTQVAVAQFTSAGILDTSFSTDGLATAFIGNQSSGYSVAVQSDGKIVVAGAASGTGVAGNSQGDIGNTAVFRFATNGNLDTTFDGDGIVTTDFFPANQSSSSMQSIAVQADGKIVVGGDSNSPTGSPGGPNIALARYNSNGSLDTTFSGDGIIVVDIGTSSDHIYDLAIHTNGKIVVTGDSYNFIGGNYNAAVVQLNSNGTFDNTFGTNGIALTNISGQDYGYAVAAQSDGKVVVAGIYNDGSNRFVARYNANGTLDNSFDGDGINSLILFRSLESSQYFRGLALQADGKAVVVGTSAAQEIAIARLTTNGTLDGTFGNRVISNNGNNEQIKSIATQADGKIVAAGHLLNGTQYDFRVARYTPEGLLDTTFGSNGFVTIAFGNTSGGTPINDFAESVKIQSDGKIVIAGRSNNEISCQVARLNSNGTLDNTFSGDGLVRVRAGVNVDTSCYGLAIQTDGKIVASGGANAGFVTFRFNSDGSLDNSFAGGFVITQVTAIYTDISYDVVIQADGKIVAGGTARTDFGMVRYNSNGSLDTTFDTDGIVLTTIFISNSYEELGLAIQPDGKVIAAFPSALMPFTNLDFRLLRFNTDGSFDNSFGTSGSVLTDFGSNSDIPSQVGLQSNGKIVVAGTVTTTGSDFALARYNSDGSLDTTFDLINSAFDNQSNKDSSETKYLPNLNDYSFLGDGKVLTDVNGLSDTAYGMAIQPDDKIIVGGYTSGIAGPTFALVRYRGSLAPLAANVSVAGRVLTKNGNGIRNAVLRLIDANGTTHTARTNAFGFYTFDEIPTGTAIVSIYSKRFTFTNPTQILSLTENVGELDFTAIE